MTILSRRQFWKYIRAKRKDASGVSPLLVNDSLVSDSVGKAAALSNQFQSVFTREDVSNIPNLNDNNHIAPMPTISFTTAGIQSLLSDIDPNKAQGPDKIAPFILKNCAFEITPILQVIFEQSLNSGILPSDWLTANICPIFKKGNRSDPSNYQPISLTAP